MSNSEPNSFENILWDTLEYDEFKKYNGFPVITRLNIIHKNIA